MRRKLRRGVSIEQLQDDLERIMGKASVVDEEPVLNTMEVGEYVILEGGVLYWRDRTGLYKSTGTKVG